MHAYKIKSIDKKAYYEELFDVPFEQLPKSYYPQDELESLCSDPAVTSISKNDICSFECMSAVMKNDRETVRQWNAIKEPEVVDLLRMKRISGKEFFIRWNINTKKADEKFGKGWLDDDSII